ncbi:MAG TPA: AAA-like domain-containing protein [Chthoniobacteraceae bacterium]|nr:AAA-like domain-containing protein [Chthoniobacteraceae bacterium]
MTDPNFYDTQATLDPHSECYIERPADRELVEALRDRKYSFILSARKVGKSSLLQRAFVTLRQEGVLVCGHEFVIGSVDSEPEQWYYGLASSLALDAQIRSGFLVDPGWVAWWKENSLLPPMQRLIGFLREFLLSRSEQPWVVAFDEIDTTLPLPFSDDFFVGLRGCYNARSSDPLWKRLTFLLVGVASPADLIKSRKRTPFNIGTQIDVGDFRRADAARLLRGLGEPEQADHPALVRIFHWTDGYPYLTQRLFLEIAETLEESVEDPEPVEGAAPDSVEGWSQLVDDVVAKTFFKPGVFVTESHFKNISESRAALFPQRAALLGIYRRALRGEVVQDDAFSPAKSELKLSGLLKLHPEHPGRLIVRNRIYERVFDQRWIAQNTPVRWTRNVALAASVAVLLAVGGLVVQQRQGEQRKIADLIGQIDSANQDVPTHAYTDLAARPGQKSVADEKMAAYWDRQALKAEQGASRDEAIVLWLKARSWADSPARQSASRVALETPMTEIGASFRHEGGVTMASFSEDGTKVVTASDETARVWDAATGQPRGAPLRHLRAVSSANFSADGTKVVTASEDKTARVWDAATGQPLSEPLHHEDTVHSASFSPDGTKVVTASDDETARVWNAATGQPLSEPLRHEDTVNSASFSADGTKVVTASDDQTARVWDAATGQPLGEPLRHEEAVYSASFSADGTKVVTASSDSTARVWETATGQPLYAPLRHEGFLYSASFSADGTKVVTASADRTARVWEAATGQPLGAPLSHQDRVNSASFSAGGTKVITASNDRTARVWDTLALMAITLNGEGPGLPVLPEPPAQLLETWQRRLSLKFRDDRSPVLVPMYSTQPRKTD